MNVFFTADPHYGHKGILNHRAFASVDEMNYTMTERHNSVVGRRDLVYIIGDFAWKNHAKFISLLHGKKVLILGSHDKMNQEILSQFTEVHRYMEISVEGQKIVLFHNPIDSWEGMYRGVWHFYGHSHGRTVETMTKLRCDVGVDVWDYQPVSYEVLKKKMEVRYDSFRQFLKGDRQKELQERVRNLHEENIRFLRG
ncbi:metallophosphoesterase [Candidatus Pacearchaeota archaeon]|nr:hypothetical protein [uncultured archaeon]MBS3079476.1 metallophosphoesterase [Candidatus Pacearchaeota archaeon]